MATAMIETWGLRVGQEIDWRMSRGVRRIRLVAVPSQPEARGDLAG